MSFIVPRFSQKHMRAALLLCTLGASLLLATVGWRWQQNLEIARNHSHVRREAAADAIVVALQQSIAATEEKLRDQELMRFLATTPDSISVTIADAQLDAFPHGRLLFYPVASAAPLATTANGDVPAELLARSANCDVLNQLGRTAELKREALELRELLLDGRWRITRSVFEVHLRAASRWAGAGEPPATYRLALSDAVDNLWSAHAAGPKSWTSPLARSTITARGMQFTVLSQTIGRRTNAFIAGPAFVEHQWKPLVATLEKQHRVRVALHDTADGRGGNRASRRMAGDTRLPWTITVVWSGNPVPDGE